MVICLAVGCAFVLGEILGAIFTRLARRAGFSVVATAEIFSISAPTAAGICVVFGELLDPGWHFFALKREEQAGHFSGKQGWRMLEKAPYDAARRPLLEPQANMIPKLGTNHFAHTRTAMVAIVPQPRPVATSGPFEAYLRV